MMAGLLKASDSAAQKHVRSFSDSAPLEWPPSQLSTSQPSTSQSKTSQPVMTQLDASSREEPTRDEASELREQLVQMDERWESFRSDAEQAENDAYERGVEDGKKLAVSLEQERLEILGQVAAQSQDKLVASLDGLEALSLQISSLALGKIFGDRNLHAQLIAASIRHRCNQLASEMVTRIRVSADDFPNPAVLADLASATGRTDIEVDPKMESGGCVVDLKLGQFDIGIGSQWQRLKSFLENMQNEGVP